MTILALCGSLRRRWSAGLSRPELSRSSPHCPPAPAADALRVRGQN